MLNAFLTNLPHGDVNMRCWCVCVCVEHAIPWSVCGCVLNIFSIDECAWRLCVFEWAKDLGDTIKYETLFRLVETRRKSQILG